jgi:hypothetical protein
MLSLWHQRSHPTQLFTIASLEDEGQEGTTKEGNIKHSTSKGTSSFMASAATK